MYVFIVLYSCTIYNASSKALRLRFFEEGTLLIEKGENFNRLTVWKIVSLIDFEFRLKNTVSVYNSIESMSADKDKWESFQSL